MTTGCITTTTFKETSEPLHIKEKNDVFLQYYRGEILFLFKKSQTIPFPPFLKLLLTRISYSSYITTRINLIHEEMKEFCPSLPTFPRVCPLFREFAHFFTVRDL